METTVLYNMDGSEMTAAQFIQAFEKMQATGEPMEIKDFGRHQTAFAKIEAEETRVK